MAPLPTNESPSLTGVELADGKYSVGALIGRGAMGDVYKATHTTLQRTVAIKVLNPVMMRQPDAAERFRREALAASRIDHPHSMAILDFGQEDDLFYIVMEFLEGRSLSQVIKDDGPLLEQRIVTLMSQCLSALARAHDEGIIHRDLKPDNIVITRRIGDQGHEEESAKVCDFGIAKINDPGGHFETLTEAGSVSGTPQYMSPEQGRGQPLDARSDLYSCGVILYRMCTGVAPFSGDNALSIIYKQISDQPPPPTQFRADLSKKMQRVLARAMEKEPNDRYQTARDMRDALQAAVGWKSETLAGGMQSPRRPSHSVTSAPTIVGSGKDADSEQDVQTIFHPGPRGGEKSAPAPAWPVRRVILVVCAVLIVGGIAAAIAARSGGGGKGGARSEQVAVAAAAPGKDPRKEPASTPPPVAPPPGVAVPDPAPAGTDSVDAGNHRDVAEDTTADTTTDTTADNAADNDEPERKARRRKRTNTRKKAGEEPAEDKPAAPEQKEAPPPPPPPPAPAPPPPAAKPEPPIAKVNPVPTPKPPNYNAAVSMQSVRQSGSLSKKAINRALRDLPGEAKACYAKTAKAAEWAKPATTVKVRFDIDEDGGARRVNVSGGPPGLASCIADHAKRIRSRERPDTGIVEVSLTLRFTP